MYVVTKESLHQILAVVSLLIDTFQMALSSLP